MGFGIGKAWVWGAGALVAAALVAARFAMDAPDAAAAAPVVRAAPRVAGFARTPDGRPVAGVELTLRTGGRVVARATSDAEGAYHLAADAGETAVTPWRLHVDAPEGFRAEPRSRVLAPERPHALDIVVARDARLVGRLADATGAPLADVELEWIGPDGARERTTTRADGGFAVAVDGPAGSWTVRLLDRDEARAIELVETDGVLAPAGGGELELVADALLRIPVELPGAPPFDAEWRAELFAADRGWAEPRATGRIVRGTPDHVVLAASAGAATAWVLTLRSADGLWFGSARVEDRALRTRAPVVVPVVGRGVVEVSLRGDARGAVVRATPLDAAAEHWLASGAPPADAPGRGAEAAPDVEGRAELGPLDAGAWLAWVYAGGAPIMPRRIDVRAGERIAIELDAP